MRKDIAIRVLIASIVLLIILIIISITFGDHYAIYIIDEAIKGSIVCINAIIATLMLVSMLALRDYHKAKSISNIFF